MEPSPFQNILVGVDFSTYSKLVVKQGEELAREFKAKLILVHALPELGFEMAPPQYAIPDFSQPEMADVEKSLIDFYQVTKSENLEIVVKQGFPQDVIIALACKLQDPLILVGSEGRNAVSRFILGSHAERIAMQSPFPVWIHRGDKVVPFSRILVPTDLSEKSRKLVLKFKDWSKKLGLSTQYLFIRPEILPLLDYRAYVDMTNEVRKTVLDKIKKFKEHGGDVPITTLAGEDPSQQISKVGEKFDVIAMNPHGHSEMFHAFGRVTAKVLRLAHNPVLVVKT